MRYLLCKNGLFARTVGIGLILCGLLSPAWAAEEFVCRRSPLEKRTFVSEAVEETIRQVKASVRDPKLAWMFENCYPNTLDTTVDFEIVNGKPDTFIITGDIDAMWLRDSTCQVWPYMPLISKDSKLRQLIQGLIARQAQCVLLDPYANAFYKDKNRPSEWQSDRPAPAPGVHERKWEVDSLCYVIRLAYGYYRQTGDLSCFDADWDRAMRLIAATFRTEQRKDGTSHYRFSRTTSRMTDAPVFEGTGQPARPVGMICSMFRPSDDATILPYLIPSNLFAVQSLRQLAEIYRQGLHDAAFAEECLRLAEEVEKAVKEWGTARHLHFGKIYAYEADGFGNRLFLDDSNVPSLLSLAYLGVHRPQDAMYRRTRDFVLSRYNPWYLEGRAAQGLGSPHTGKNHLWPMGIILRGLTSRDAKEIRFCLHLLKTTDAGTGFMHESFHKDNPNDFSRHWFAWANTLFGEFVVKVYEEHPEILKLDEI